MALATTANGGNDALVDRELVLKFMGASTFWLVFAPSIGVILAIKFNFFDFLGNVSWLTWGRLRPMHIMGVVFGAFSTTIFGLTYYIVPKLCGVRMYKESWGIPIFWLWNAALAVGLVSLAMGYNSGIEAGEFPLWVSIPVQIVLTLIMIQVVMTIVQRKEPRIYVALWYLTAAYIWTVFNYAFGHFILPYSMPGVNNAAMHGLYIHYVVGLWITPAGLAVIYYFLPLAAQRPLYSHKLSLIGFWSLAFFYPFVGTHHYIYSPIPYWTQTIAIVASMMLIIPVWTVIQNFYGTFVTSWRRFQESYTAKFLIIGAARGAKADALHGFRDRALAPDDLRHVHPVGDGRHVLRNSTPVRARAVLEIAGPVALLADRGGLLGHGRGTHRAGADAGHDAPGWQRLRRHHGGHEALLVHANSRGPHDGHRCIAGHVELVQNHEAGQADRGARRRLIAAAARAAVGMNAPRRLS
jgi:hypothetical protein